MNTSSKEDKHLESEIYIDNKSVNTESAILKNFHAAIVEFVKELLRPTLNFGILSKVAYKEIVQKTVDKVKNSLHPNQIRIRLNQQKSILIYHSQNILTPLTLFCPCEFCCP
ncbi:hypothetical protein EJD97_019425, partial [Solanum chilense]